MSRQPNLRPKHSNTLGTSEPGTSRCRLSKMLGRLLNRTCHSGKGVIRVRSHQPDRAHHKNQNYRKHDSVLGDVLSCLLDPEPAQSFHVAPRILEGKCYGYQVATAWCGRGDI